MIYVLYDRILRICLTNFTNICKRKIQKFSQKISWILNLSKKRTKWANTAWSPDAESKKAIVKVGKFFLSCSYHEDPFSIFWTAQGFCFSGFFYSSLVLWRLLFSYHLSDYWCRGFTSIWNLLLVDS